MVAPASIVYVVDDDISVCLVVQRPLEAFGFLPGPFRLAQPLHIAPMSIPSQLWPPLLTLSRSQKQKPPSP